ncbi:MAG TPA: hypothetical protein VLM38_19680 [Blastocatellia bacterium]|nr:hypothetical protein [Blastocatellia bacterium]
MNAGRVHAVIAAGLENPQLLARWRQEPELLRSCGVDPDEFDLDALWKFAGLTGKVRHNGLRADLPLTFRLLNVAGLEIEVFASYASLRASEDGRFADTTEGRTQDLLTFLENWLDLDRDDHALLWDLIRHELALTQLSRLAPTVSVIQAGQSPPQSVPRGESVPRVCGQVVSLEMRCDPRIVGAMLQEKSPRLDEVPLGKFHFCYWRRDAAPEIHILALDELGFYLIRLADGKRSTADLSRLMGGSRKPARGFLKAVGELAAVGILGLDATSERAL